MSQHVTTRNLVFGAPVRRVGATSSNRSWGLLAGRVGAAWRARRERGAVARFAAEVNALDVGADISESVRARLLEAVTTVAGRLDLSRCAPNAFGYGRRALHEEPGRWSLAAISFRPGQATAPHDHDGWGCAVVVRGLERERRFAPGPGGQLVLVAERDFAPGEAYGFDPEDIHQPIAIAPDRVTVSLHFLLHGRLDRPQRYREVTTPLAQ